MVLRADTLSPMVRITFGLWADPGEAALLDDLGELGVLGEEPVPRMNGVGARHLGGADQRRRR